MEFDRERFRKMFPNLYRELEEGVSSIRIDSVRLDSEAGERVADLRGYSPDVIDFIRRAETEEQALEVIDYCERRGEISSEYAEQLRKQLRERGLESFGSHKEEGYYFRIAGYFDSED